MIVSVPQITQGSELNGHSADPKWVPPHFGHGAIITTLTAIAKSVAP